jgi:hypothetical protein
MYDGVEGYISEPGGLRTFSYQELKELTKNEFSKTDMLFPLPDYKLPSAVISECLTEEVDCSELFSNPFRFDYDTFELPRMYERYVWRELGRSNLIKEFANSFMIVATNSGKSVISKDWLGDVYAINRKRQYQVRTSFLRKNGRIAVQKSRLFPCDGESERLEFEHICGEGIWENGISVHAEVAKQMCAREDSAIEDGIREKVLKWWNALESVNTSRAEGKVSGNTIDLIWHNAIIRSDNGEVVFIDNEWHWKADVAKEWVIYRVAKYFLEKEFIFVHRWFRKRRKLSVFRLMMVIGNIVGVKINYIKLLHSIENESKFICEVSGVKYNKLALLRDALISSRWKQKEILGRRALSNNVRRLFRWILGIE